MGLGRTYSVALVGLNGYIVEVEADIGQTLPAFIILGLPDASLNEAKERIRSAAQNSGIPLSRRKITANLIPANPDTVCQPLPPTPDSIVEIQNGTIPANTTAKVMNPQGQPVSPGSVGELWLGGQGVAMGIGRLVSGLIDRGKLVAPFCKSVTGSRSGLASDSRVSRVFRSRQPERSARSSSAVLRVRCPRTFPSRSFWSRVWYR